MARLTRKYNGKVKHGKRINKSRRLKYTSKRRHSRTRSRSRKGGYEMTRRQAKEYLREYKQEAPYLEEDEELEVYNPELDIDDNESPAYILGNKPPPRPSRFTGKVDTSDLTGIQKKSLSWNPFSRITRKNKIQRTGTVIETPVKPRTRVDSDTDSLTDSEHEHDYDDGSLEDIYEEVRADQQSAPPAPQSETKPSFFSRLFGKKSEAQTQAQGETQKKPWYKFWGGLNGNVRRKTRKLRKIKKSRKQTHHPHRGRKHRTRK